MNSRPNSARRLSSTLADVQEQQDRASEESAGAGSSEPPAPGHDLARDLTLYTLARIGMLVALTGVLTLFMVPLLVAAAVSVVVVMPLSLVVLRGLRHRVAVGMAERSAQRRARRDELRAQLRGERDEGAGEDVPRGDERVKADEDR
jgi:hypothetical protein